MLTKRYVEKGIERLSLARNLSIWWADRQAAAWARRNPGKPFSDYYVDHVRQHLDRGKPHPTLGSQGFDHELGSQIDWDRANFANRGRNAWREYLVAGVIDELHLAITPVVLGRGESLFAGIDLPALGYSVTENVATEKATHVVLCRA